MYPSPGIQTKTKNAVPDNQAQAARKTQLYIQTKSQNRMTTQRKELPTELTANKLNTSL